MPVRTPAKRFEDSPPAQPGIAYDVLIAGAGPAGLFAGIAAGRSGASALILERMPRPGLKLLISGSGQCNLTHAGQIAEFLTRYGDAGTFLRTALYGFSNDALTAFCAQGDLALETTAEGKVFPASRRARDVLDLLLAELARLNVRIATESRVREARRTEDGYFEVRTAGGPAGAEAATWRSKALVLAQGGRSWPRTGSGGDGYDLARAFGHRITEVAPALCGIIAGDSGPRPFTPFASCAGISIAGTTVAVFRQGKKTATGSGDVLFTHRGLSGPGILDLSRSIRAGDEVRVSLAPGHGTEREVDARLRTELDRHGTRTVVHILKGFGLPERLGRAALAASGADPEVKAAVLPRTVRQNLVRALAEGGAAGQAFDVADLASWDEAMVTRGGVDLREVDPRSMESRLVPGLYLAGELLDVDGDSGGFNIQAAASTGYLAGLSAARAGGRG